jgi:hypothetical protein
MMSHGASGDDIDDKLLGRMARQVGLDRRKFLDLVDCPLSRDDLDELVKEYERTRR